MTGPARIRVWFKRRRPGGAGRGFELEALLRAPLAGILRSSAMGTSSTKRAVVGLVGVVVADADGRDDDAPEGIVEDRRSRSPRPPSLMMRSALGTTTRAR